MQRVMLFHDGAERGGGLERVEQFAGFPPPSRLLLLYHRPVPKRAFVFDRGPPASGRERTNRGYERLVVASRVPAESVHNGARERFRYAKHGEKRFVPPSLLAQRARARVWPRGASL